jgi:hypothetical protein
MANSLLAEQRRQHAFASAASAAGIIDALASAGAEMAATALIHAFSAQLLHACLPPVVAQDPAQLAALTAQAEPEENEDVLQVLKGHTGFADLEAALGPMYTPPDDLHGVPETIIALTMGAGVSASAQRRALLEGGGTSDTSADVPIGDALRIWQRKVRASLQECNIVVPSRQSSSVVQRSRQASLNQSTDADQRLSQLVAYGWRLRAAHLHAVSRLLQTMARPFAEMAARQSAALDDFRLYTLSASDRLQPLSAALVCMRCVCNEKARARLQGYYLRDVSHDSAPTTAWRQPGATNDATEGLEMGALPCVDINDQDGDFVPPPPAGPQHMALSLQRSQSAVEAEANAAAATQEQLTLLAMKLAADYGTVGRLTVSDSGGVVDDDVALLASVSSRQVDLAVDAHEYKLAVAAAAAQPLPDAASSTLRSLAVTLLEHRRVPELVTLNAAPRIWGTILEALAWRARTSPVPLSLGGAHMGPLDSAVLGHMGESTGMCVDACPLMLASAAAPGSNTLQVLDGAARVDVNAYTVLASVATSQLRWADAAGWYYALAYRQAAAAASVVQDLQGVPDSVVQSALALLARKVVGSPTDSAPSTMRAAGSTASALQAAVALSVVLALVNSRSVALACAVACLACLPDSEAFLVTLDTADKGDVAPVSGNAPTPRARSVSMQAITAQDVEVESAAVQGQALLLQTALTAEARQISNTSTRHLASIRESGVLGMFRSHVLAEQVHWGALAALPAARSALCSVVCISLRLWVAAATRQHAVVWSVDNDAPVSSLAQLQLPGVEAGHGPALVSESFRLASAGRSTLPAQCAPGVPGVVGAPLAPIQLALCEVGAYGAAAQLAHMAGQHRQHSVGNSTLPVGQRAEPMALPLSDVVRHAARRLVEHGARPQQLPAAPVLALQQPCCIKDALYDIVLQYDSPATQWAAALAVVDEVLLASEGQVDAPQWAVDVATWGVTPPPASFTEQLSQGAGGSCLACGHPAALLSILWQHGHVHAAASVAACCLPSHHTEDSAPVALMHSLAPVSIDAVQSPAQLVTCSNMHAPSALPVETFKQIARAAGSSGPAQLLRHRLAFFESSVLLSQEQMLQAATATAVREAEVQITAARRSRRAGIAATDAFRRATQRDTVRRAADDQVISAAMTQQQSERVAATSEWEGMMQQLHGNFIATVDPVAKAIADALHDNIELDAVLAE